MGSDDLDLLAACFEARRRQQEMLPLIAAALGVPDREVFYLWTLGRRQTAELFERIESIPDSSWTFNFHGLECDLHNTIDGRFLRYDFGPGGRCDCVTAWGILQFVMTSKSPWCEFPTLRERLADTGPPYDYLSGDNTKVWEAWGRLEAEGCFEPADRDLVAFQSRHTSIGRDGIAQVSFPAGTQDETMVDCMVAHRQLLTARARAMLEKHGRERSGKE